MKHCPACRVDYPAEKRFCKRCGAPLVTRSGEAKPPPRAAHQPPPAAHAPSPPGSVQPAPYGPLLGYIAIEAAVVGGLYLAFEKTIHRAKLDPVGMAMLLFMILAGATWASYRRRAGA